MNGLSTEMRRLYIVRTNFTSPQQRESTEILNDRTSKITLRWGPEIRQKITTIRNECFGAMKKLVLNFYGLSICRESDREVVTKIVAGANGKFQELVSDSKAQIHFIPLYLENEAKGEVYQQVLLAVQGRIYYELFEKLKKIAQLEEVPTRSRTALLKLCDRMHAWNVVDDPNVKQTIEDFKLQFNNSVFKPVLEDLKSQIESLKNRGAYLEFDIEEKEGEKECLVT